MTNRKIIVIKYGSSSVTNNTGMDGTRVNEFAAKLAPLHNQYSLLVVSSGSIAYGKTLWQAKKGEVSLPNQQPLAMLGSAGSFIVWQEAFAVHDLMAGQLLVSHREIDDPTEGGMLKDVLAEAFGSDIVTVANENDAVSIEEVRKLSYGGDNDGLAAQLAQLVEAKYLLLMTDTEGLMDESGRLIREVDAQDIVQATAVARGPGEKGRGGMAEKVKAAWKAAESGIDAYIAHANAEVAAILAGETGTHFIAQPEAKHSRIKLTTKEQIL